MRIVILTNFPLGLYKFRKEVLACFIAENHEVYICLPDGEFVPELKALGCRFINVDIERHGKNPLHDLGVFNTFRTILKKIKPSIVFTYTIKPNIYGGIACSMLKIPYVTNITGLGTAVEEKGILQFITTNLYKFALRNAQTVFFQNEENEKFFRKLKIANGKHKLLPGSGVNLSEYNVFDYPSDDTIDFVFVSRIMKEKGIDQYLETAKYIRKKYPQTRFHICGFCEEAYEDKIKALEKNGLILYHGLVKDMREMYKKVHCVIHPSYYPEGLSNVLLEASASGRPIITTDRSGCREVIDDGVNGYMIPQKDAKALVEAVEKFISLSNEERKAMGLAGRAKVEKEFDRQIVVDAYMKEL